jgi:hypothetical protein
MEARQTDVNYPPAKEIVEGKIDGIAGGIMDLLENHDPNFSAVAQSKEAEPAKEEPEEKEEPPVESASEEPEDDKYTIKWQGQEKEVTQKELIELAQKGFDYTQKTQALAEEKEQLAPYQGLANQIRSNPALAQQIASIIAGNQVQKPEEKKFDDPVEQLKYETKQEALAEIRREMAQNLIPIHRQQALNQVRMQVQADPDYKAVHQKIIEMVQTLPPANQKVVYTQLDQDPQAYLNAFQFYKNQLATAPEDKPMPKVVKKETKAPFVDTGGISEQTEVVSAERTKKLRKQKAEALRKGDPISVANWLMESGAIDHLY